VGRPKSHELSRAAPRKEAECSTDHILRGLFESMCPGKKKGSKGMGGGGVCTDMTKGKKKEKNYKHRGKKAKRGMAIKEEEPKELVGGKEAASKGNGGRYWVIE